MDRACSECRYGTVPWDDPSGTCEECKPKPGRCQSCKRREATCPMFGPKTHCNGCYASVRFHHWIGR
jgi:hypothetical protein